MADKAKVLDALLDLIAEAVVAKIVAEGATVGAAPADEPDEPAPSKGNTGKKAGPTNTGKKAGKAKDKPDRDAIYEKVKELSERDGKPAARTLIQEYAPSYGEVSDEDLPKLLADVEAALEEEAAL